MKFYPIRVQFTCIVASCMEVYKVLSNVIANKAFNVENNALLRHRSIFNNSNNNNNNNNNNSNNNNSSND